jgi:cyclophilin family peptidyl-prolyl cis-trans isomerase
MTDRRQRQKEQRAQKRQAQRKQEQRRELGRRITTGLVLAILVIGFLWVVNSDFGGDSLPRGYQGFRDQPTACGAAQPPPFQSMSFSAPEPQSDITAGSRVTATMVTSCGTIVLELDPASYPETVNSFVFLSRQGFYNGQVFHRVIPELWAQGGDPNADGTGGPGYVIADERPPADFTYERGIVAMANRGARSTGSQFFMITGDDGRFFTNTFNVLGRITSGEDVLSRIEAVPRRRTPGSNEASLPTETIYIETITIEVAGS